MAKHNCGGTLKYKRIVMTQDVGKLRFNFSVPGQYCIQCGDEVLSRNVALELEKHVVKLERHYNKRWEGLAITVETPSILSLPLESATARGANQSVPVSTACLVYGT